MICASPSVLLVTATSDLAADLLVLAARERGLKLIRLNQDDFPDRLRIEWHSGGEARFHTDAGTFAGTDVTGAWFRRKSLRHAGHDPATSFAAREIDAYLTGVWEAADWFWMNRPLAVARAEHKLLQLRQARRLGLGIPETLATNNPHAARGFAHSHSAIAKTMAGGTVGIEGVGHAIFTTAITPDDLAGDDEIAACPVLFQRRVATAFDVRVTVVAERVFPARIILRDRMPADTDWRAADPARLRYDHHVLPSDLEAKCVQLVAAMGLSYGALDFIVTPEGEHVFLEINPSGQWGWIERALGLPITNAILDRLRQGQI